VVLFFTSETNKLPREALWTSLRLGAVGATLVMLAATILITYAHHADRRIGNFIRGVTKVPSAISGLVIAVAVLFTFAGPPFSLKGTFLILLLAYLVMFMPQASLAAEAARGQVGDELLERP
jgi:iron(III) transport system permease protein